MSQAKYEVEGTHKNDGLVLGDFQAHRREITVLSGQTLTRGAILEPDGSDPSKFVHVSTPANAAYILAEDCDASAGDQKTVAYATGSFDVALVTVAGGTIEDCVAPLEAKNIYLRKAVA